MTAESLPDLSVVVVTWNSRDVTAACLDSFREQTTGVTYELFLIDNGSTKDDSAAELPRRFPWARFTANPDNRGFTRANNQAIREAQGRYVLLLNSDTIQTENAAGAAVAYMDAHPDVGALGIMHRNADADRTFQPSCHPFPRPWGDTLAVFGLGGKPPPAPEVKERDADWVCGSFMLIRREALEQVGLLDERYFAYNEDIDWCLAARRAGWKVRYWPGASMIHIGSVAAPHLRDKTGLMFRSQITYLRKNHGRAAAAAYYAATNVRLALAAVKQLVLWSIGRGTRAEVGVRLSRLRNFVTVRPGKAGG